LQDIAAFRRFGEIQVFGNSEKVSHLMHFRGELWSQVRGSRSAATHGDRITVFLKYPILTV
jgi:hypothetical protein